MTMDQSHYRDFKTSRGYNYHYFFAAPKDGKPVCLLLHGFPSTSYDWRHQVAFLTKEGYGVIAPDMLGYGGTEKPSATGDYRLSLIGKDLADILDHEKVDKAVVIGHDWGSTTGVRFINRFPERILALCVIAVGYRPPNFARLTYAQLIAGAKARFGSELFGYWSFFSSPGAPKLIEDNFESFFSLLHAEDASLWKEHLAPTGAFRAWIEAGKTAKYAEYITPEDKTILKDALLGGGFAGPLNYYKLSTSEIGMNDDSTVPKENVKVSQPVLFIAAKHDAVTRRDVGQSQMADFCPNGTVRVLDGPHYVHVQCKDEANAALREWMRENGL